MPVRSLGRTAAALVVSAVTAATLATAVVAPATAAPKAADPTPTVADQAPAPDDTSHHSVGRYRGEVIAKTGLNLHDKPYRSARIVGSLEYGTIVRIFCRVSSDPVDNTSQWYLLADGSWAWATARYIRDLGAEPHEC
ncbi:SH3 domain-containing protein [Streptomyces sp. NPDC087850]|uniref:SH3 domain-containing protein n=1 Tax=Streptomyces sp. NPDC087850 TaxID=3365809 RepID=UPI0038123168